MKRRLFGHLSSSDGMKTRVEVIATYDPDDDPYRLSLAIRCRRRAQVYTWEFGRDLLVAGLGSSLDHPAGEGHVRVWFDSAPSGRSWVVVQLLGMGDQSSIAAWLELGAVDVAELVDVLYAQLPAGAEDDLIDWEREIRSLLAPRAER